MPQVSFGQGDQALGHRPGRVPSSSGVIPPRGRGRQLNLSLGTTDEDRRACQGVEAPSRAACWYSEGVTTELELGIKNHEPYTRREPGGWGRCPATRARRRAHEDCARPPRWSATAETVLPGRSRRVRRCGRIGRNCTTRRPSVPGSTSPSPPCHGERPARASSPWEARPATASEGR